MYPAETVLLAPLEKLIAELPPIGHHLPEPLSFMHHHHQGWIRSTTTQTHNQAYAEKEFPKKTHMHFDLRLPELLQVNLMNRP
jgi:hypothetical protein